MLKDIKTLQKQAVEGWHENKGIKNTNEFLTLVLKQHRFNYELWHQEDIARKKDVSDSVIAEVKRNIDQLNQQRNNHIEKLDEFILNKISQNSNAKLNSETMGSIIDRLSIGSLKIYHMAEQFDRTDVDERHIKKSAEKLRILKIQRDDLFNCLVELYNDIIQGNRQSRVYRQFKMYNDPSLNPELYKNER